MPARNLITEELADLFGVLAHPQRIRIIEELGLGERDVSGLQAALEVTHSRVSQHLSLLRAHRLVVERREGRRHIYRLAQPEIARWILDGLKFFAASTETADRLRSAAEEVRALWGTKAAKSAGKGR